MSYKGMNYGKILEDDSSLKLVSVNGTSQILSINFDKINNSTINKSDIVVQTAEQEVGNDDCLCEIRFYVQERKQQKQEEDNQMEKQNEGEQKPSVAELIYKQIVQKAKIGEFAGESIATLLDVNLSVPRGKYTIDFYQKNIRFHGMTFNYNIEYRNITKGFILPMTNESQISIVLQLNKDKPIYQGATVYKYIVIQVKKDIQVNIKTKVSPQALENNSNLKQVQAQYNGPQYQVLVDLIHATAGINLIQPGNHFKSTSGQPCVKANIKAQPGWLYMMKQSIIYIPKPILYFKIEDISAVQFHRINASSKQFDIKLSVRQEKKPVQFIGIERADLQSLVQYFKTRQIKIIMEQLQQTKMIPDADDDESEDQDFEADEDDDDSDEDSDDDQDADQIGSQEQSSSKNKKKAKKSQKPKKQEEAAEDQA